MPDMQMTKRKYDVAVLSATIGLCFWLIFLHLVLTEISVGMQIQVLLIPLLLRDSHWTYTQSKLISFALAFLAMWAMLWLSLMTLLALVGD